MPLSHSGCRLSTVATSSRLSSASTLPSPLRSSKSGRYNLYAAAVKPLHAQTNQMVEDGGYDGCAVAKKVLHAQINQMLTRVVHHIQIKVSARCGVQPEVDH